jgi:hypothetical protein
MFRLLRRLFGRRDPAPDAFGYTVTDREIFRYRVGNFIGVADPLATQRAMMTDPDFDAKYDPGIAAVPTTEGLKATGRLAAAVRRAFGLKEFAAGGPTDGECLQLFVAFSEYLGDITEESRPLASSPGPMASAPAAGQADGPVDLDDLDDSLTDLSAASG